MKRVLLGLGSNKSYEGKTCLEVLECAKQELSKILSNIKFSSVYKTKAMYVENQDDFYNMACIGYVDDKIDAFSLLKTINKIEEKYGRNRDKEIRFGPRSLDIDIELFGDEKINDLVLQVPHIRVEERAFVLIPSLEILDKEKDKYVISKYEKCLLKLEKNGDTKDVVKL